MSSPYEGTVYGFDEIVKESINKEQAFLYLVQQNSDLRISVAVLLSLVDKAHVGLSNVDNTADVDKPISELMRQALALKAEKDHSHEISGITGLDTALSGRVLKTAFDEAIAALTQAVNLRVTNEDFSLFADSVTTALQSQVDAIGSLEARVHALEQGGVGGGVTQDQLAAAIQAVQQEFAAAIQGINTTLNNKLDKDGKIDVTQINNFNQAVIDIVDERLAQLPTGNVEVIHNW